MNKLCFGGSVDGLDVLDGLDGLLGVHHRRGQVRLVDAEEGLFGESKFDTNHKINSITLISISKHLKDDPG